VHFRSDIIFSAKAAKFGGWYFGNKDEQETQLSLTNRATHFCKYSDKADLTSVIKIRLKK